MSEKKQKNLYPCISPYPHVFGDGLRTLDHGFLVVWVIHRLSDVCMRSKGPPICETSTREHEPHVPKN